MPSGDASRGTDGRSPTRDRDREKDRERHRDRERDKEKDSERDRGREKDKEKERDRDKEREPRRESPVSPSLTVPKPPANKIAATTFTFDELKEATGGFSNCNFLGEGGFGRVYKGKLQTTGQVRPYSS